MTHTTATGVALGLLGVGIGAVTYAYSQFSAYQEAEKARAAAVLSGLKAEADAYEKVALGVEKAARARGGIGAGKGPGLARRAMQLDIPGVGPETRQRAAELLAAAGGPASDEDIENVALGITLGDEPTTGTERAKGRRMRRGDLGVRRGRMGAWRIEAAGIAASADRAMLQEQEAFRPEAEVARRLADLDTLLKTYPELQRQFSRWSGRTREAALMEEIRARPEIGMEGFAPPFVAVPGTYYGRSPGGRRGIDIVENHFHGGVQTIIQDRKMEAGSVPVNRGR
jgi:hypothetical protein